MTTLTTQELFGLEEELSPRGKSLTKEFEGFESLPYQDNIKTKDGKEKSVLTVGYGFNLDRKDVQNLMPDGYMDAINWTPDKGEKPARSAELSKDEADGIFDILYSKAKGDAVAYLGSQKTFDKLDEDMKDNLVDMSYNLGLSKLNGFKNMREGFLSGDKEKIATEMKDSEWYKQTGRRGKHHVETMQGKRGMLDLSMLNQFAVKEASADEEQVMSTEELFGNSQDETMSTEELFGASDKDKGFIENIKDSFKNGILSQDMSQVGFLALTNKLDYEKEVKPLREQQQKAMAADPIKGKSIIEKAAYSVSEMLPAMIQGTAEGLGTGSVAGGMSAAGGVAAIPMFAAGTVAGSMSYWYRQGAGDLYMDLKDQGIDDGIAKPTAHIAGVLYAAIEFSQVEKLIPWSKGATKKLLSDSLKQTVKRFVVKYGINWAQEVGEEGLQEVVIASAEEIANKASGGDKPLTKVLTSVFGRGFEAMKESAVPMLLLMGPGAAVEGARVAQEEGMKKEVRTAMARQVIEIAKEEEVNQEEIKKAQEEGKATENAPNVSTEEIQKAKKEGKVTINDQFTNANDPKMLNHLAKYLPVKMVASLSGEERLRIANMPPGELRDFVYDKQLKAKEKVEKAQGENLVIDEKYVKQVDEETINEVKVGIEEELSAVEEAKEEEPDQGNIDFVKQINKPMSEYEKENAVEEEVNKFTFNEMVKEAQRWKGAAIKVDESIPKENKKARLEHSRKTTKGDLDKYLMKKYNIDASEARNVSNELTAKNLDADKTAEIEDFKDEKWAKWQQEEKELRVDPESKNLLKRAAEELKASEFDINNVAEVAEKIARMENSDTIKPEHMAEAIQYSGNADDYFKTQIKWFKNGPLVGITASELERQLNMDYLNRADEVLGDNIKKRLQDEMKRLVKASADEEVAYNNKIKKEKDRIDKLNAEKEASEVYQIRKESNEKRNQLAQKEYGKSWIELRSAQKAKLMNNLEEPLVIDYSEEELKVLPATNMSAKSEETDRTENFMNDRMEENVTDGRILIKDKAIADKIRKEFWDRKIKEETKNFQKNLGISFDEALDSAKNSIKNRRTDKDVQIPNIEQIWNRKKGNKLFEQVVRHSKVDKHTGSHTVLLSDGKNQTKANIQYYRMLKELFPDAEVYTTAKLTNIESEPILFFVNGKQKAILMPISKAKEGESYPLPDYNQPVKKSTMKLKTRQEMEADAKQVREEEKNPKTTKKERSTGGQSGQTVAFKAIGYGKTVPYDESVDKKTGKRNVYIEMPEQKSFIILDEVLKVASPAHRTDKAFLGGRILRANIADLAHRDVLAQEVMNKAKVAFEFMADEDKLTFIDNLENGLEQGDDTTNDFSSKMREILDDRRNQIHGLGKGHLESFYADYFPHIWKDPNKAKNIIGQIMGRKRLEGTKSFLKKRSIVTVKEGIERGLELVSMNPADLVLLKVHEMDRYIMAQHIIRDLKEQNLLKFVYSRGMTPEGYAKINDNAFTVFMPPEMNVKESYDMVMVDQLMDFARNLGIDVKRFFNIHKRTALGYAMNTPEGTVRTKYATPESVLFHEIGHILGYKYSLYDTILRTGEGENVEIQSGKNKGKEKFKPSKDAVEWRKKINVQWRALADERYKALEEAGRKVSSGFKGYVRNAAEKEAVLLEAFLHAPKKFQEVAPDLYRYFRNFLNTHSELRPLIDIEPSLILGESDAKIKIPGFTTLGFFTAPESVATLLNNYLSPGLRNSQSKIVSGSYNLLRGIGNVLNQAQLSLSAFHAFNVTTDMISSTLGVGFRELSESGQRLQGLTDIITAPLAPFKYMWNGQRIRKAYKSGKWNEIQDPYLRKMVQSIIAAGGRDRMDVYYYNNQINALRKTMGQIWKGAVKDKAVGFMKLPFNVAGTALELMAKPLMEWYVPTGKIGLFAKMAEHELKRAESGELNNDQLWQQLTNVWDSVDNRMGQLIYDNLFWDKTFKDSLMLGIRSVGWNLGSWREFGGVVPDILTTKQRLTNGDKILSHKIAYTMGTVIVYSIMGAVIQRILTGKPPEEPKDYFFPKTGYKNTDGTDERLTLPTYAKDWVAWGTRPLVTATNKLHPILGLMGHLAENKDFFNVEIRDESDPILQQLTDVAKYVGKEALPMSIKNYQRNQKTGSENVWVSISGIGPAPSYITKTPAQKLMTRYVIDRLPSGTISKDEYEKRDYRRQVIDKLRKGEVVEREEAAKILGERSYKKAKQDAKLHPIEVSFKRLTLEQALNVYNIMNDGERLLARDELKDKFTNAKKKRTIPFETKKYYYELLRERQ